MGNLLSMYRCTTTDTLTKNQTLFGMNPKGRKQKKRESNSIELAAFVYENMIVFTKEKPEDQNGTPVFKHISTKKKNGYFDLRNAKVEKSKHGNVNISQKNHKAKHTKFTNFRTFDRNNVVTNEEWIRFVQEQKAKL